MPLRLNNSKRPITVGKCDDGPGQCVFFVPLRGAVNVACHVAGEPDGTHDAHSLRSRSEDPNIDKSERDHVLKQMQLASIALDGYRRAYELERRPER